MKNWQYRIIGALLLLVVTNPNLKDFKSYLGSPTYSGLRRSSDFFVCSIYNDGDRYFAIADNFFKIKPPLQEVDPFENQSANDTTRMLDTSIMPQVFIPDTSSDKYLRFYNNLMKLGFNEKNLDNFKDFKQKIKVEKHARRLHQLLIKEGYSISQLGTEDNFVYTFCQK